MRDEEVERPQRYGAGAPEQNAALDALLSTGVLGEVDADTRGSNAYPTSGGLNDPPTSFSGSRTQMAVERARALGLLAPSSSIR